MGHPRLFSELVPEPILFLGLFFGGFGFHLGLSGSQKKKAMIASASGPKVEPKIEASVTHNGFHEKRN